MTGAHKVHSDRRCPDCTGRLLVESYHDESCPLFMAIKAEFNRDREWFEAHPAAHEYYRPVSPTESIHLLALDFDLNAMPPGWHWGGRYWSDGSVLARECGTSPASISVFTPEVRRESVRRSDRDSSATR